MGWHDQQIERKQSLSTIWIEIPEDIHSILFHHMPLLALCRFRCVCKNWNVQIGDKCKGTWYIQPIIELRDASICTFGFSLMQEGSTYWRKLPLHFELPYRDDLYVFFDISVSSNDLVCIHSTGYNSCAVVCNPFSKWFTWLPPIPHVPHQLFFKLSRNFYVDHVISTWLQPRPMLHVYTSSDANWVASNVMPFGEEGGEIILSCYSSCDCMVLRDNRMYLISMTPDDTCSLKSMNVFDPCQDVKCLATWTKFSWQPSYSWNMIRNRGRRLHLRRRGYVQPRLVLCESKFVLVMLVPLEEGSKWGTTCVYILKEESKKWKEISYLPLKMLPARNRKGLNLDLEDFTVAGGKNQVTLYFNNADWGCVYDVLSGNWYSIFGQGRNKGDVFFSFQPSLTCNV